MDDQVQVGLEVFLEDGIPAAEVSRELKVTRSVHPLSAIQDGFRADPLQTPLLKQKFLLGVAPIHWDRKGPPPHSWPAVPVLVLCSHKLADGTETFMVIEKRDLVDPSVKTGRIYLVPKHRLRLPQSEWDYDQHEANLTDADLDRVRGLLRQQVLFSWTHHLFSFQDEEPDFLLETETERFVRRAQMVLAWLAEQSDDDPSDSRPGAEKPRCADFLYAESQH